jgi:flagellin
VAAREPGVDRAAIQSELTELQSQLANIANSSSFSGQNWLSVDSSNADFNATASVVSSFSRAADGSISIGTINISITNSKLYDASATSVGIVDGLRDSTGAIAATGYSVASLSIGALSDSPTDLATLESYIKGVDKAIAEMTEAATSLGSVKQRIGLQQEFVRTLLDSIDRGVSTLVDADMNEESTRLQALQVQQQLGVQALAIANSSSQNILSLFRQ